MCNRLEAKVAIVTGGGHGIGRAFSLGLAAEGAKVAAVDIDGPAAQETAELIQAVGGHALGLELDVSDQESTLRMAIEVAKLFGGIDILINNAAIFSSVPILGRDGFMAITLEEWDRLMAVNVKGVFLCVRAVFPYMQERGKGKIINISSDTFFKGVGNFCHYVTSKGAVTGMTRSLARELGSSNIAINAIAPGVTLSDTTPGKQPSAEREGAIQRRCFKRVQTPEDLVGTAIFLASADSDFITGQTIVVDGGDSMN